MLEVNIIILQLQIRVETRGYDRKAARVIPVENLKARLTVALGVWFIDVNKYLLFEKVSNIGSNLHLVANLLPVSFHAIA